MAQTYSGQASIVYMPILLSYPQYMIDVAFCLFAFSIILKYYIVYFNYCILLYNILNDS